MKNLLLISALALVGLSCSGGSSQTDDLLAPFRSYDAPGGATIVIQNGEILAEEAFGLADVESGRANTLTTNFRLASCTKQFTAMAIMILADRGKLTFDQTLTGFFPDYASVGQKVTVRHLLTHTSGLVDYEDVMPDSTTVQLLDADVLRLVKGIDSTYFAPGTAFRYSNTAYALLALIVEKVSGMRFAGFLQAEIFKPLGMENTVAYERGISEVKDRAYGHSPDESSPGRFLKTDQSMTSAVLGDGGIYSSVLDLEKWDASLRLKPLVSPAMMQQAFTPQVKSGPGEDAYGFGWYLGTIAGYPSQYHAGSTVGFRTFIIRVPARATTVIVLFNRTDAPAEMIARRLMERAIR